MTSEDDLFDQAIGNALDTVKKQDESKDLSGRVLIKVLHTRTEITIYPGGNVFQKSQSWFEGATYEAKKKEKAKPKQIKQATIQTEEIY